MYDINLKNVKKGKNAFYLVLAIGLLFLVILSLVLFFSVRKQKSMDSSTLASHIEVVTHTDDEGSTMYSPVYYFKVRGREYTCKSTASSSVYPGTKNKLVYFDSKNPNNCITEYTKSSNKFILLAMIIPLLLIVISVINFIKIDKRVKAIKKLNKTGKLVKNLPYRLENTGTVINNVPIQRPVVDYKLNTGTVIKLFGDPRNDKKTVDQDGMVDLIIDENNPDNYYIDLEINRLSGNLPTDYYQPDKTNTPNSTETAPNMQDVN